MKHANMFFTFLKKLSIPAENVVFYEVPQSRPSQCEYRSVQVRNGVKLKLFQEAFSDQLQVSLREWFREATFRGACPFIS